MQKIYIGPRALRVSAATKKPFSKSWCMRGRIIVDGINEGPKRANLWQTAPGRTTNGPDTPVKKRCAAGPLLSPYLPGFLRCFLPRPRVFIIPREVRLAAWSIQEHLVKWKKRGGTAEKSGRDALTFWSKGIGN